jgi:hypothetical protein
MRGEFCLAKTSPQRWEFQRLKRLNIKVLGVKRQGKWHAGAFSSVVDKGTSQQAVTVTHYD